jgi:regulator of protease activity HflC (stomatin/prohibitin superfamily)
LTPLYLASDKEGTMSKGKLLFVASLVLSLQLFGCAKPKETVSYDRDYVFKTDLKDVRLGDGVPLTLALSVRWKVEDVKAFSRQFPDPNQYALQVLDSKSRELGNQIANKYSSVASVFRGEREKFVQEIKQTLSRKLSEKDITIKEVILSDIQFPKNFTDALELGATKDQELERIRQKNVIDLESAKASQSKAEADGEVEIEQAKMEGKVAEINAQTEDKRRLSQVAKAETEAQVLERKSKAEVARAKMIAQQEAEKQRELNKVQVEKETALKDLEIQKQKDLDGLALNREKELATLCATNPTYASFLVNRELASKVQLAVLPVGTDSSVLGSLIHGSLTTGQNNR